ncbi:MAG TPA: anhydro-N-acetylmuramic acid kinase [Micromonosporaceae bacterium]
MIGCMSGTSYDAIDAVAVDICFAEPDRLASRILGHHATPMPVDLRERLAAALPPAATSAADVCLLDTRIGQAFADAAGRALAGSCDGTADLIVSSGQTFFHWIADGACLGTLQLGEPAWIAEATGLPVVSNLRSRDVACGGHGAPLVSLVDSLLFGDRPGCGALNIGGIANVTIPQLSLAFDIGPGNALIDAVVAGATGGRSRMDTDGAAARRGRVDPDLLDALLADPHFARVAPKSTGKERFHAGYLGGFDLPSRTDDIIATLTALTARTIADTCHRYGLAELIVSGGGADNPELMGRLCDLVPRVSVRRIDEFGIASNAKEAYAFAVLGFLSMHGLPGARSAFTGARRGAVLGSITPGAAPLRMPPPAIRMPTRLTVLND